jgi:lipopolysaccharide export system permease protein
MKILDRYIARSFLIGYAIALCVLIGLWIVTDLFVNLDEFTEHPERGTWAIAWHITSYYGLHAIVYYRDLAGVILVVAATFSLGKMLRDNELTAIIASGISAQRIGAPILGMALLFTGVWVADQELLIPALSSRLVRAHGDIPGQEYFRVRFLTDGSGSLIYARAFFVNTFTLDRPVIITRRPTDRPGIWQVTGWITAECARFNESTGEWDLDNGRFVDAQVQNRSRTIRSYRSPGLLPKDIPIICESQYASLFSSRQLSALANQEARLADVAELYSQKHFRITEPLIDLTMLMVSLPVLIRRDPRTMKSAIFISFILTTACFVTTFLCKMLSTEAVFAGRVMPELWAWLPVFIFLPVAFIELDTMRT